MFVLSKQQTVPHTTIANTMNDTTPLAAQNTNTHEIEIEIEIHTEFAFEDAQQQAPISTLNREFVVLLSMYCRDRLTSRARATAMTMKIEVFVLRSRYSFFRRNALRSNQNHMTL